MKIYVISAFIEETRGIGIDGDQPFFISEDLKNFKEKTRKKTVIMGRKTWEAIPEKFRPLPGRHNIVLTTKNNYLLPDGVSLANSYLEALETAQKDDCDIWIIGGASLYKEALKDPNTQELHITNIRTTKTILCDTFFPKFKDKFKLNESSEWFHNKKNNINFRFEIWIPKIK